MKQKYIEEAHKTGQLKTGQHTCQRNAA